MSRPTPFGSRSPEEYYEMVSQFPPAEDLVAACLADDWDGAERLARGQEAHGELACTHMGLQGPPGRVHGGLHVLLRLFSILDRIPTHTAETAFPCAFSLRLRKALSVGATHPFTARYFRRPDGQWSFASRFLDTPRLDAAAWSLPDTHFLAPEHLNRWRERYDAARMILESGEQPSTDSAIMRWANIQD